MPEAKPNAAGEFPVMWSPALKAQRHLLLLFERGQHQYSVALQCCTAHPKLNEMLMPCFMVWLCPAAFAFQFRLLFHLPAKWQLTAPDFIFKLPNGALAQDLMCEHATQFATSAAQLLQQHILQRMHA